MDEIALPLDRFSAKTHSESLEGLVDRYEHEGEPIHYKKAAVNVNETTCSSCLRYFNDLDLIKAEKQGVYVPSQSIVDYFTKVGKAKESATKDLISIIIEDTLFKEISFHLDNGGIEKTELANTVAGHLEINKDDIKRIKRAIDIFAELEALQIDEDGKVTLSSDSSVSGEKSSSEPKLTDTETTDWAKSSSSNGLDFTQIDPVELDLPPTSGDPESLLIVCNSLTAGGTWTSSELAEKTEFAERTARGHIRYGEELGFIERKEEGLSPTERGYDLGFQTGLNEETGKLFLQGILESEFYVLLLSRCFENVLESDDTEAVITVSSGLKELRTYFGFTEESERTLRDALNTFFQTIEAAGYGKYVIGRGGKPTRVQFTSGQLQDLQTLIDHQRTVGEASEEIDTDEETGSQRKRDEQEESLGAGPPLRISSFRIRNYRNIQDTGVVRLENITTFIGKNESGKTSTLEAIASFHNDYPYLPRDICNDINYDHDLDSKSGEDLPIVTLTFDVTDEVLDRFYPDYDFGMDLPVTYEMTKFADGHIQENTQLDISPPSPNIVYYNDYDIISDSLYFDEPLEDRNKTFKNLLKIGELTEPDIIATTGLEHHQAIEHAENLIESRLNEAWSQKDIRLNLRYSESENSIQLFIQDDLEDQERHLTEPSQRSEGFQWFFSFYVNLIAETATDEEGYKILLLDDPAVHLHPSGKQDWLDSLEEIAREEQVLYTSHSPYLIEKQYPSRIRTVEDSPNGTQISADVFDADTGTLEPLRNALGINLSSSPFVSEGQILVEGPSEYYILTAVGAYFENVLEREFINWNRVSIMPVRGANDTIGKASWLASEKIEYVILLDSDEEGQSVKERINGHHQDIDNERVLLLERRPHDTDVVLEDLFHPGFYVKTFNEYYKNLTADFDHDFEPLAVESDGHNTWEIGVTEYDGSRIDQVLITELERQDVADELRNDDGEIDLKKRQISEAISDMISNSNIDADDLEYFNPILAKIENQLNL